MFVAMLTLVLSLHADSTASATTPCDAQTLRQAASRGQVTVLRTCLAGRRDVDVQSPAGVTLLMIAAASGRDLVVRLLLERGANVDARTSHDGITPLMLAAGLGRTSTVRILVERGHADVTLKDSGDRRTALEWAVGHAVVKELAANEDESTAKAKSDEIAKYLVEKGAVVRETDIIQGILMFASPPDLPALIRAALQGK